MQTQMTSFRVGDVTITKLEEQVLQDVPLSFLYPGTSIEDLLAVRERIDARSFGAAAHSFLVSVHSWIVRTPKYLVIIDTASGNDKERPSNPLFHRQSIPYLARLASLGIDPDDVDYVFNTHLHVDHSGWNTRLEAGKWLPTFPNARYLLPVTERDYYASPDSHNEANLPSLGVYEDSVRPVIEAGLVDFVPAEGGRYLDMFEFVPTPGHSIGHMSIVMTSNGEQAVFAGDVLHNPFQVYRPDLNTVFCEFHDQAEASRRDVLERVADSGALYLSTHFPGSSAGRIARGESGYLWNFE